MKKVYIIHGWGGSPDEPAFVWSAVELEKRGYEVIRPAMPDPETPVIESWVSYLEKTAKNPDENSYFLGHSIGCQTIMRYLEKLPRGAKVGGAIFIAGWFNLANLDEEEIEIAKPWIETPIDFEKIKSVCPKISIFLSSNEPYGYVEENKKTFEQKLNAKVTILKDRGHFRSDTGEKVLPEVLEEFLNISK